MARLPRHARSALRLLNLLALTATSCLAAATLTQNIDPPQVRVGQETVVTITVQNGTVSNIHLPDVDGVTMVGSRTSFSMSAADNSRGMSFFFVLSMTRVGDITIPAFDLATQEGDILHVNAMKIHVSANSGSSANANAAPLVAPPATSVPTPTAPTNGPVVMPPANATSPATQISPTDTTASGSPVPRDPDGTPAKVFIIISPQTTEAYVGQSVPMAIDFYIRADVNWQQNSLPTIEGSDFLMNSFKTRGRTNIGVLENEQYLRESWLTSIAAPKSGDFSLTMSRDTYWIKSYSNTNITSFFGNMFGRRPDLAHEMVTSNTLTMHVMPLPEEGRPDHFTGAIGHFRVVGEAGPDSVDLGEPVTLRFTISGDGNFDYVRCPALADDPEWKAYVPRSGTNYLEESHTNAVKTFEQSVIARKNGNVPLPAATFSYFDPTAKQYVTVPIALPEIEVTGTPPPVTESAPDAGNETASIPLAPAAEAFLPNRLEIGSLQTSLVPAYRHPWFWAIETTLVSLPFVAALMLLLLPRRVIDAGLAQREIRERSVRAESDAMSEAVRRNDPLAFFTAARHAIQLQLGAHWSQHPESITLREIARRDPALAESLAPFFAQADEIIYSGRAPAGVDLAHWDKRVRTEFLQPQPA